jgi:flagellar biosynthesis/type III secretory pathway protein FliH
LSQRKQARKDGRKKEGRRKKEGGRRKEGRMEGRKEGRNEGRKEGRKKDGRKMAPRHRIVNAETDCRQRRIEDRDAAMSAFPF